MLKLLIVDDEPLVQMGISSMLQLQSELDITICGTASNGAEALEKICNLSPEIVISDIKMPIMDGLELAQKSKELYGDLPVFIMLTSYEEFEFARKAIECQVCDYLIKIDLTPVTLVTALKKALSLLDKYVPFDNSSEIKTYSDKFLFCLLNNLLNQTSAIQQAKELGLDIINYSRFLTVAGSFDINSIPQPLAKERTLTLHLSTLNMLKKIIQKYAHIYFESSQINHFSIIFCFNNEQNDSLYRIIQNALNDALTLLKSYFSIKLSFGIGTPVNALHEIHSSFSEAKTALEISLKNSDSITLFKSILEERKEFEKTILISDIQKYIDTHLTEKLTLNSISQMFGISAGYLSTLYKKNLGITFIDYINYQKIELSKTLLIEQKMKIYEIADYLGFDNTYYYSKVFRRYVGCSPSDYIHNKM